MREDGWDRLARNVADGRVTRRRAFRTFAAGALAVSVPWAFPRQAEAADCGTYCASGGGCNPPDSGCCCFDTAPGVINVCGCYNPETEECVYEGGCIVRGKETCPDGRAKCGGACCEQDERCENGVCVSGCASGTVKCGGRCCDEATHKCCGNERCCPKDGRCCGGVCCKPDESCCKDQCCKKGQKCVDAIGRGDDVQCCEPSRVYRQGGRKVCCPRGTVSTHSGCCPKNDKDCCGDLPPLGRKRVCVKGKVKKI